MKKVILSQRAYLSILAEVYERVQTETGGILLGHREGDTWYVLESVEPGPKSIFTPTYFEYDDAYVTYRANKLSRLYKCSIELLGLWHRHPGLLKTFSSTDDGTNKIYSDMLDGAISGIVTLGNGFEITMYYVPSDIRYEKIECIVDNEQIPENYLAYYDTEYYKNLINEASTGRHSAERPRPTSQHISAEKKKQPTKKKKAQKTHHYSPEQEALRKGFLYNLGEKIADKISDLFEGIDGEEETVETSENETASEEEASVFYEDNDIAFIFDTIESEIAYLQQMEANGEIKSTLEPKKDSKGKDGLIVLIEDLRQPEESFHYRIIFFVHKKQVMVKKEDGKVQPYTDNLISMILGG